MRRPMGRDRRTGRDTTAVDLPIALEQDVRRQLQAARFSVGSPFVSTVSNPFRQRGTG